MGNYMRLDENYKIGDKCYKIISYDWKNNQETLDTSHVYEIIDTWFYFNKENYGYDMIPMCLAYCSVNHTWYQGVSTGLVLLTSVDYQFNIFDFIGDEL